MNFYCFLIFVLIIIIESKQTLTYSKENQVDSKLVASVNGEIKAGEFSYYEVQTYNLKINN